MDISRQDLQVMMDNTRVKAKNELQVLLNQVRDKVLVRMDTYRQVDRQLMKQAISVAEQAVHHVVALESRTALLEQEVKVLKAGIEQLMQQRNLSVPASDFTNVATSGAREQWQYSAA
jgi:hypothetical protein